MGRTNRDELAASAPGAEERCQERVKKLTRMSNWNNVSVVHCKHEQKHFKHSGWAAAIGCGESAADGDAGD
jgi:hypothetical protein